MTLPAIIIHADWSRERRKRMAAVARLTADQRYEISGPAQFDHVVPEPLELLDWPGPVLMGFDFPIGVPEGYGARTALGSFPDLLRSIGQGDWTEFNRPAERPDQITVFRPFYPARPGGTSQIHLVAGHGVDSMGDLHRQCELRTLDRPAACCLFWTLGGNQVGKAAVSGWQEVVVPLIENGAALWPYDGMLAELLSGSRVVITETYPTDAMRQIGFARGNGWSKRRQAARLAAGSQFSAILDRIGADLSPDAKKAVDSGFGADALGEDRFDAFVGLLGMIFVVRGLNREGPLPDPLIQTWEGWILGQSACDGAANV